MAKPKFIMSEFQLLACGYVSWWRADSEEILGWLLRRDMLAMRYNCQHCGRPVVTMEYLQTQDVDAIQCQGCGIVNVFGV